MHPKLMLIALSAALAFAAGSASASLVSVNFYADGKPDGVQVESELLGPLGGGNTTWTQIGSNSDTNPVDSSGSNTTTGFSRCTFRRYPGGSACASIFISVRQLMPYFWHAARFDNSPVNTRRRTSVHISIAAYTPRASLSAWGKSRLRRDSPD